jgi:hypothetical protein
MKIGPTQPFLILTPFFLFSAYLVKTNIVETRGKNLDSVDETELTLLNSNTTNDSIKEGETY